jgi:arginase
VAIGAEYECHACGRTYGAGLVRVPKAWGSGGEAMAEAAYLPLPYPEAAVVEEDTLSEQNLAVAAALPERPLVLGGCCCAHVGAIQGLATRHDRLAVVWLDAHGDLNTPATSLSGNVWGMPLRMLLDSGTIRSDDTALLGARSLDPPEEEFIASEGIATAPAGLDRALDGADAVYVAIDVDVLDPAEPIAMYMPEPGGLTVEATADLLARVAATKPLAGAGFTGLAAEHANGAGLTRFSAALGI